MTDNDIVLCLQLQLEDENEKLKRMVSELEARLQQSEANKLQVQTRLAFSNFVCLYFIRDVSLYSVGVLLHTLQ